jgi:DNA repair protein RecO (recombination protein O)
MKKDINLQEAYVLHYRPYRETSLLVDLLTQYEGRICVIAKGARRPKSPFKGLLQPFISLEAAWVGRGDLPTLRVAEAYGELIKLSGNLSFSGFYLNELLMRVLHRHDSCERIFFLYKNTLKELSEDFNLEILLRKFERQLLDELGYGLQFSRDANTNQLIEEGGEYSFMPNNGFTLVSLAGSLQAKQTIFSGDHLLAIADNDYQDKEVLQSAKRLMRLALRPLLGDRPLKSRELFF